ncbi:hypothetical protein DY218_28600 [Streptomyces triticagri]|uniref:Uncharacterized protein n=1 Tax=Streptomyces triticagri TaxID=2293568 RepID=A0A372LY05_9ACTN|nr:hypothetical protein [Streptomyces triticagri]RFU83270.1 hypothetical protein DY218_28600 [Streptomyces triticagri]
MATTHEPIVARHWLALAAPKAAPALATSTVLILGRIWNANGAEHSVGGAVLMTALAAGCAAAGAVGAGRLGDTTLTVTAFSGSAALALAGVAGYTDGLSLPLLLWAIATVIVYGLAARLWRHERRDDLAHDRQQAARREDHAHVERVAAIEAGARIEVARAGAEYAEQLATALITRATLPGYNPTALADAGLPQLPYTSAEITKES